MKKLTSTTVLVWFIIFGTVMACREQESNTQPSTQPAYNTKKLKDQFVEANQLQVQKESDEMDVYERTHGLRFFKTRSGVRYHVYQPSESGDSIRKGMAINLHYTLYLLNGTPCYTSDTEGLKGFVVEEENMESGIHIGLQYLKRGDKALFLIPSHLAHGLLGDYQKIPPQMPIVYDVEAY